VAGDGGDAVRPEDFGDEGEVLFVRGVEGVGEPVLPVDGLAGWGELFLPAAEVEVDLGEAFAVADFGERGIGEMGGGGGVGVVLRAAAHAGADGVLLNIEQGGAVVRGAEGDGAEVVFPKVAVGALALENFAGVLRLEVAHEVGDGAFAEGFEDEVDVVGHQAEAVDADFVAAREPVEAIGVGEELGLVVEDGLAAVAPLVDVIALAALEVALGAGG